MPVQTRWYLENHVLFYDLVGQVSFEEVQQLNDDFLHYVENTPQVIHSIADIRNVENLNLSMKDMARMRNVKTYGGWTLVICTPASVYGKLIQIFLKLSEQLFGMRVAVVESTEAAETFLMEKDPDLSGKFQQPSSIS